MIKTETVSLDTLKNGAVKERFDMAMAQVIMNVLDLNTDWSKTRKITLTLTIKPNEERDACDVKINSDVKLAPVAALSTEFFIGKKGDQCVALERSIKQGDLVSETPFPPGVEPIHKGADLKAAAAAPAT